MKLVVFDVDGTLVDSQQMITGAMRAGLTHAGFPDLPREEVLAIVGLSLPIAVARLLPDCPPDRHQLVVEGYREAFHQLRLQDGAPLYPGAQECLDLLASRDDLLLAIATGKSRRGLTEMVEVHGWQRHFISLQCADHHPSKPHPAMLQAALAEAGVAAADAVMVGDTEFDIAMAVAARMPGFGVGWGYHPAARLTAAGAALVAPDYPALTQSILSWADE